MSDYTAVKQALASGADPSMLCTTCPWDRNCVSPPDMTSGDIADRLKEAAAMDKATVAERPEVAGEPGGAVVATLMTAMIYAGRDTSFQACPVLALRLRSGDGRKFADLVKNTMQSWEES